MRQFVWRKPLSESALDITPLDDAIAEWAARFGEAQAAMTGTAPRNEPDNRYRSVM
jgi:hypothetical protein